MDNKFGKRLSFFLVPVYFMLLFIITLNYNYSNYFDFNEPSGSRIANSKNYEDQLTDDSDFINNIGINRKVITDSYVKVIIIYSKFIEDDIYEFNPDLKPEEDERGISSNFININIGSSNKVIKSKNDFLDTFNTIYSVEIDSVIYKTDFILGKTIKNQNGFETYIGTKNLEEGKHVLKVKRKAIKKEDTITKVDVIIPFWYYPN